MSAAHIARSLGGTPSAGGFVCRCPLPSHGAGRGDRNPSLSIRDGENGLLLVRCHAGCDTSEVIAEFRRRGLLLIGSQRIRSTNANAQRDLNSGRPPQGVAGGTGDRERIRSALGIWSEAHGAHGTLAGTYLARRGIDLDELPEGIEQVLRFHPACPFGDGKWLPCLVALYRDIRTNEPRAVHRTALTASGEKIDRKALGPKAGCAIKLSANENVCQGLTIGEGVETTLAGMALGFRPKLGARRRQRTGEVSGSVGDRKPHDLGRQRSKRDRPGRRHRVLAAVDESRPRSLPRRSHRSRRRHSGHHRGGCMSAATRFAVLKDPPQEDDAPATVPNATGGQGVSITDFWAYMPMHQYIFAPTGELWPASSVNARLPPMPLEGLDETGKPKTISASAWLDQTRSVEQMTWFPGKPAIIADRLVSEGGWIERPGCRCFNLYRPPALELGDARSATPWLDHCRRVLGDDAEHVIRWLAHRVQRPHEKINHALVLIGAQGIGKDTLLEPVKRAIGPWNFAEVTPKQMFGRFNGFIKSVILRVSEARDLGDVDRYSFYDHLKAYTAAPPDVLRCDEKHLREYAVPNVTGVIITSNHKTNGIYLPADDRRHFVAWSGLTKEDFSLDYWRRLWSWYEHGGDRHVAAYLAGLDISAFDPKAPPPKTPAFWDIVTASHAPESAELADALDKIGNPAVTTISEIANAASSDFSGWLLDRRNSRQIPHRLEDAGYVAFRNLGAKDGLWKLNGRRQVVYAKAELSMQARHQAMAERWSV